MTYIPTLTHATERDIDLLLVEEFATSPDFVRWFLGAVGLDAGTSPRAAVFHSTRRMHNRREIDISVEIATGTAKHLLLVENKLDADEQPDQAQSYRAEAKLRAREYTSFQTVLICPKEYGTRHVKFARAFDQIVRYEQISGFLEHRARRTSDEIAARCAHRGKLMRQAIDKQRRGYAQVIHPAKRAFTRRYVERLKEVAPSLIPGPSMLRESAAESVTMIFAPETLPKWRFLPQTRIVHQLREGNANINFYRWGDHFVDLASHMAASLKDTGFRLVPTVNKRAKGRAGLMIVAPAPKVDHFGDFDAQNAAIREGIAQTLRLQSWFRAQQKEIERWSAIVAEREVQQYQPPSAPKGVGR